MSPRIRKEFLLLFPYGVAALAIILGIEPYRFLAQQGESGSLAFVICLQFMVFALMGALTFGFEFGEKTIERLLSNPIPRRNIWREKISVLLGIGLLCIIADHIYFLWLASFSSGLLRRYDEFAVGMGILAIGLTTPTLIVLYSRQTHTAFWAGILLPLAVFILGAIAYEQIILRYGPAFIPAFFKSLGPKRDQMVFWVLAPLWCVLCLFLSHRKFLKLEV